MQRENILDPVWFTNDEGTITLIHPSTGIHSSVSSILSLSSLDITFHWIIGSFKRRSERCAFQSLITRVLEDDSKKNEEFSAVGGSSATSVSQQQRHGLAETNHKMLVLVAFPGAGKCILVNGS